MDETAPAPAATAVPLPEDILLEILARVKDGAALFACATTCKRWRRLVADRSFLRRCWPEVDACHRSSFLAGFLTRKPLLPTDPVSATSSLIPTPRSVFGPGRRFLDSFFPNATDLLDHHAMPLISRRGLLLVSLTPCGEPIDQDTSVVHLAVCNLLAGTCRALPPLSCDWDFEGQGRDGYALLTGADCGFPDSYSNFFRVLVIGVNPSGRFNLYVFSSDEPSWTPSRCFYDPGRNPYHPILRHNAVVCRGAARWFIRRWSTYTILDVNAETCDVSMTPVRYPWSREYAEPHLFVAADGTLEFFRMQRSPGLLLEIYARQNHGEGGNGNAEWLCTRVVQLKPPEKSGIGGDLCFSFLGENSGTLLVKDSHRRVNIADLESGLMEEVTAWHPRPISYLKVVPLEMNWTAFFVSRLGGSRQMHTDLTRSSHPENR